MNRISLLLLCILFICLICVYKSNSNKEHFGDYIQEYSFSKRFDDRGHYHTDFLDRATPGRFSEDPKVITYWVPTSNEDDGGKILSKIMYDTKYKVSSDLVDDQDLEYALLTATNDKKDAELINRKCTADQCDVIIPDDFGDRGVDEAYDQSIRDVIEKRFNFRESKIPSQGAEQPDIITSITIEPKRFRGDHGPIEWHPWSKSSLDTARHREIGSTISNERAQLGDESMKKELLRRVKFYDNIFNRWASKYPEHIQKDLQHKYKLYNLARDYDIILPVQEILLEPLDTVKDTIIQGLEGRGVEDAGNVINQLLSTTDTSLKRDFIICRKELGLCIDNDTARSYGINREACTGDSDSKLTFIKNKYLEDEDSKRTYCDILHSDKLKISKDDTGEIQSANIAIDNCPNKYINQVFGNSDKIEGEDNLFQIHITNALGLEGPEVEHTETCGSNSD